MESLKSITGSLSKMSLAKLGQGNMWVVILMAIVMLLMISNMLSLRKSVQDLLVQPVMNEESIKTMVRKQLEDVVKSIDAQHKAQMMMHAQRTQQQLKEQQMKEQQMKEDEKLVEKEQVKVELDEKKEIDEKLDDMPEKEDKGSENEYADMPTLSPLTEEVKTDSKPKEEVIEIDVRKRKSKK